MLRSFFLFLASAGIAGAQPQSQPVIIDGELSDVFWDRIKPAKLSPVEPATGVAPGEVRATLAGRYLYLGARLPEPSGRFTARSVGKNPQWEEEDSIIFVIRAKNENDWLVQVGPLGGYSVKWRWTGETDWYTAMPERCADFLIAAHQGNREWEVEAAIPLEKLGTPGAGSVHMNVERVRAARPGVPATHWRWPADQPVAEVSGHPGPDAAIPDPVYQSPLVGNSEPPLNAGRRTQLPPLDSGWTGDAWREVPVWTLQRNEAAARVPVFPTEIKMMQDSQTLSVLARCAEPFGTVANTEERDGPVDQDDSFQLYLATSGSSYVKYAVNPLGYVLDANGYAGGERISRPHTEWNSPVRAFAWNQPGEWFARLDIPLEYVAKALGEAQTPRQWRILFLRHRPGRSGEPQETSVLPITQSVTAYCPARYRRLVLADADPSWLAGRSLSPPSGNLAFVPTRVLSQQQRQQMDLPGMLDRNIHDRTLKILEAEKRDWDKVRTLQDWESFRAPKLKALAESIGGFPPRKPLDIRVVKHYRGDEYQRQDLVYQSQPGFWVTANLYLPNEPKAPMPGIIIAHSLHAPKTQFELQDMGILWARSGCAVLVIDQVGYGERFEGYPWAREFYHSRYVTGMQLYTVGESLMKWMVWDLMRGVDLLVERKDVDEKRIILIGAVAGGGDPAAVTAALDQRIAAVVPFNFGESTPEVPRFIPEKNQWPRELADPGLWDWETPRCLRRGIIDQFLQWTVCAMAAPRKFVYSYELGWNVEDLPAWDRYKKVYELYQARQNLADAHGFGPFPGPGECWNVGPAQRMSLYPTLERWFGIPIPLDEMRPSVQANLARVPKGRRLESELEVLDTATAADLHMRTVHELAQDAGRMKLESVRSRLAKMDPPQRQDWIRTELAKRLGDIEPAMNAPVTIHWAKKLPDATVEGITIEVEHSVTVPLLLFRPPAKGKTPVAVGIAEGGKELFLAKRNGEIESLLKQGVAVCLPDVRGTGETSPDSRRDPENDENMQAVNEEMLGETLVGRRLKDLRTVLTYLESREDLDAARVALWGESLMPVNSDRIQMDELPLWQTGPYIQQQGEPLGGLLAILGALYDPKVKAVAIRNGLVNFASLLDDAFVYMPADVTVPGLLEAGDLADFAAALAPRPLVLEGLVDGKNRLVSAAGLHEQLGPLYAAYPASTKNLVVTTGEGSDLPAWLLKHL